MCKLIITHPGKAHRDEFLAICLLLGRHPGARVERRGPTPSEVKTPNIWVVDIGGEHAPQHRTFDHHQLPRDAEPTCALSLVGAFLMGEEGWAAARGIRAWIALTEITDSKGPAAAAKHIGIPAESFMATQSPIEGQVLQMFGALDEIAPKSPLSKIMSQIGTQIEEGIQGTQIEEGIQGTLARWAVLDTEAYTYKWMDLQVVDITFIDRRDNPTLGFERWVQDNHPDAAITISQDDRGDGTTLFRRDDNPAIDFSQIEGKDGVVFAHKSGFVAKLSKGADMDVLLASSLVSS